MRVLHISTSDINGGAARGSYSLHETLMGLGVESQMLVGRKYSDDRNVHVLAGKFARVYERIRGAIDVLPLKKYEKTDESFWTVGWLPRSIKRAVAAREPDIVHIHWTGGGFLPIHTLTHIDAPIIWTVRDMWPFTGGCHYSAGCNGYQGGCGFCPQLTSTSTDDLSRRIWTNKRDAWADIEICVVTISHWLAECAQSSQLFPKARVEVIPNGVNTSRFSPRDRQDARHRLQMVANGKHQILFGALGAIADKRKGFDKLVAAINKMRMLGLTENLVLNVFGNAADDRLPKLGIETRLFGKIDDDDVLADIYAACDVMVAPSLQEAFGKTLVEAMACGTPVVAFNFGGPRDIVRHRETGYLARAFDTNDLAHGILWCLQSANRIATLGRAARLRVEKEYDLQHIGKRYLATYESILENAT